MAISDFSFFGFSPSSASGTNCTDPGIYSGCMTSACYDNPNEGVTCICPTWDGPFQVGHQDVSCDIQPQTYSAAYNPDTGERPIPEPFDGGACIPDAGASSGYPLAYTCDATICTTTDQDIFDPACEGLQGCALQEAGLAELEGQCSC